MLVARKIEGARSLVMGDTHKAGDYLGLHSLQGRQAIVGVYETVGDDVQKGNDTGVQGSKMGRYREIIKRADVLHRIFEDARRELEDCLKEVNALEEELFDCTEVAQSMAQEADAPQRSLSD